MSAFLLCCALSRSVLISGSVADYLTTHYALTQMQALGAREANPVVRVIGPGKTIALTSAGEELFLHYTGFQEEFPRRAAMMRIALGGLHWGAAAWNFHEIQQMRKAGR